MVQFAYIFSHTVFLRFVKDYFMTFFHCLIKKIYSYTIHTPTKRVIMQMNRINYASLELYYAYALSNVSR